MLKEGGVSLEIESKGIALLVIAMGALIILAMLKSKHFFKAAFLSCAQGLAALFAVNLLSSFTGFSLGVNWITIGISAVSGIAGVVMLLVSNVFLM